MGITSGTITHYCSFLIGWVDEVEYTKLKISLADRYKYVHRMKPIQPPAPRTIFENVPWMGSDQELINFLYNHVNTKKFDPGDVVLAEKTLTEGIYILIAGTLRPFIYLVVSPKLVPKF